MHISNVNAAPAIAPFESETTFLTSARHADSLPAGPEQNLKKEYFPD